MPLLRSHLYYPVTDVHGDVLSDITVRFYEPGTTTLIDKTIYAQPSGNSELSQPITTSDGVIDAYLSLPKRVDVGIEPAGQAEFYIRGLEFSSAGDNVIQAAQSGFRITNLPSPGYVLTGNNDGTASFKVSSGGGGGGSSSLADDAYTSDTPPRTELHMYDADNNHYVCYVDIDGHWVVEPVIIDIG